MTDAGTAEPTHDGTEDARPRRRRGRVAIGVRTHTRLAGDGADAGEGRLGDRGDARDREDAATPNEDVVPTGRGVTENGV